MAISRPFQALLGLSALVCAPAAAQAHPAHGSPAPATVAELVSGFRAKAKALEGSAGMRLGYQSLQSSFGLPTEGVRYSDFVIVRLLFESTRDAGLWNLHWTITDRPPESDNIWRQWQTVSKPASAVPTASAECDELSALFAFLARSLGIKGVGLLWPYPNHTVAVWEIHPAARKPVRVVVPTTQIFLGPADLFGTRKFDPWRQRSIFEYTRRDVPASLAIPRSLLDFFLGQAERYGGASDAALQRLRYLREAVFLRRLTPEQVAVEAEQALVSGSSEDAAAFAAFAGEIRTAAGKR
ncbi:MAG: hypothetical protein ACJ76N_21935 [Thermoanaerobaculia bacterium]